LKATPKALRTEQSRMRVLLLQWRSKFLKKFEPELDIGTSYNPYPVEESILETMQKYIDKRRKRAYYAQANQCVQSKSDLLEKMKDLDAICNSNFQTLFKDVRIKSLMVYDDVEQFIRYAEFKEFSEAYDAKLQDEMDVDVEEIEDTELKYDVLPPDKKQQVDKKRDKMEFSMATAFANILNKSVSPSVNEEKVEKQQELGEFMDMDDLLGEISQPQGKLLLYTNFETDCYDLGVQLSVIKKLAVKYKISDISRVENGVAQKMIQDAKNADIEYAAAPASSVGEEDVE